MISNIVLKQARECQSDFGWSIVPIVAGTKRPPKGFPLKRYFRKPATEAEVRDWFSHHAYNLAVCLGPVSDNLGCRDFDSGEAYEAWADSHPRLAERLPTVGTNRGFHVYFTCDCSPDRGCILKLADGELRIRDGPDHRLTDHAD